jgi:hypothetical protein
MAVQDVHEGAAAISSVVSATEEAVPASSSVLQDGNKMCINSSLDDEEVPLLLRIILTDANDDDDDEETTATITAATTNHNNNNNLRNLSLTKAVSTLSTPQLLTQLQSLDTFRRSQHNNLYQRVRALFFLYAIHRFHLPERRRLIEKQRRKCEQQKKKSHATEHENAAANNKKNNNNTGESGADETFICPKGYAALLDRRFDEAIDYFLEWVSSSSSTLILSANDDDDCIGNDPDKNKKDPVLVTTYPVPRTTSLISNLTFSRDGPSVITTASADKKASSSSSTFRRYYSSNNDNASSSLFSSSSSHVSEEESAATPSTTTQQQQQLLPSEATSSALAKSYRSLAFQTLADQVKRSVRSHDGNEWMFNVTNVGDTPLVWSEELLCRNDGVGRKSQQQQQQQQGSEEELEEKNAPMLVEKTPVRMDLSHVSNYIICLVCCC